ncbi:MAG: hypothetical protein ACFCUN_03015 [Hyphomicrobiaceae bacterium]
MQRFRVVPPAPARAVPQAVEPSWLPVGGFAEALLARMTVVPDEPTLPEVRTKAARSTRDLPRAA